LYSERVLGGRVAIAGVVFVLLGLVFAGSAAACSCVNLEPSEALAGSDAAVVARLLAVEPIEAEPYGPGAALFKYRILRVYRGEQFRSGGALTLQSRLSGASCGLPQGVGRHYGLLLWWGGERWHSSSCSVISPSDLRAGARDLQLAGASAAMANCAA
jgi:hypothetical protein